MYLGPTKPNYTDTPVTVQSVEITIHTIMDEFISWYSNFGALKFDDYHPMFGDARVNSIPHNVPEYQSGDTNWDVGMACIFDY